MFALMRRCNRRIEEEIHGGDEDEEDRYTQCGPCRILDPLGRSGRTPMTMGLSFICGPSDAAQCQLAKRSPLALRAEVLMV